MLRLLVVDDMRSRLGGLIYRYGLKGTRPLDVIFASSVQVAIYRLNTEPQFDLASLDFDMQPQRPMAPTGLCVARYICEMPPSSRPLRVIVHSWNEAGARLMVIMLARARVPVTYERAP